MKITTRKQFQFNNGMLELFCQHQGYLTIQWSDQSPITPIGPQSIIHAPFNDCCDEIETLCRRKNIDASDLDSILKHATTFTGDPNEKAAAQTGEFKIIWPDGSVEHMSSSVSTRGMIRQIDGETVRPIAKLCDMDSGRISSVLNNQILKRLRSEGFYIKP